MAAQDREAAGLAEDVFSSSTPRPNTGGTPEITERMGGVDMADRPTDDRSYRGQSPGKSISRLPGVVRDDAMLSLKPHDSCMSGGIVFDDDFERESAGGLHIRLAHSDFPEARLEEDLVRVAHGSMLKLQTISQNPPPVSVLIPSADSIATSPTLRKHVLPVAEGSAGTLPAFQPTSPTPDGASASPSNERLPSFRQLTGQLSELAEAATAEQQRYAHTHRSSFSTTTQSPIMSAHPYPPTGQQTSPVGSYPYGQASPTNAMAEVHHYGSPPSTFTPYHTHFQNRRPSGVVPPILPPSLNSNTSSSDSNGQTNSSNSEDYSTSHTTPTDSDGTPRPMLPPVPMPGIGIMQSNSSSSSQIIPPGGYRCEYPDCNAVPFQTQYLLNSHTNVHSQNRPHYCPVKDCPRSEGGKGFKRKNEMIRHGLVHNSPGYVCPFCPDREHRYPRPDNLQRHVRVHHMDKDKEDPTLREVLAQRTEGAGNKTRRRRTAQQ